jgi:hypothetical protein
MTRTSSLIAALALLVACSPEPPQECLPADAPWVDFDRDGYPASVDCNDSDPTIHPAAFELCDGIDNNCDGLIDEGYPVGADGFPDCEPVEICDGIDNNYNGLIDEGFPDFDGDGIADCLDDACEIVVDLTSREHPHDPDCVGAVFDVRDPWNVVIEWQWKDGSDTSGSYALPVIARFVDTNGDGFVDLDDSPVIVITTNTGNLVAVRGDTGERVLSVSGMYNYAGAALADMNGDGFIEAITLDSSRRIVAIDRFGTVTWRSTATEPNFYASPIVADVDGDGKPEVITQTLLINGQTGTLITNFGAPAGIPYYIPTVADIDLDGEQEILIGRNVYRPDGTIKWSHTVAGGYGHWAAPVNIDGDPEAEIVIVGGSQVGYYEHDGTLIRMVSTAAAAQPGPLCVADFDGDGVVEVAWASRSVFSVFNLDGSLVWSATIQDGSGLAGCSGFDVDGDGAYEVLFADEVAMRIFDGRTGAIRYEQFGHRSGTLFEYPTVSDVDGDGSAEIVIVSNYYTSSWGTITVFGQATNNWPPSGQVWPVHDFAVTNVLPDGTVPAEPDPSWLVHNVYRARPSADVVAANVQAEITDACVSGCTDGVGVVAIAVELFNSGESDIRFDIPVTLYKNDGSGLVPLETKPFPGGLPGKTRSGGLTFTVGVEDLGRGFVVRADDNGRGVGVIPECYEDDNETTWPYPVCD